MANRRAGSVNKLMTAAALAGATIIATTACARTGSKTTLTIDEARSQAVTELRSVLELSPDTWPQDVPAPVANDCQINGQTAVQFSYYVEVARPAAPQPLVAQAGERWEHQGYELTETRVAADAATGDVHAVVARAADMPRASMAATKIRAHVNVDSVCVVGDPDDYR